MEIKGGIKDLMEVLTDYFEQNLELLAGSYYRKFLPKDVALRVGRDLARYYTQPENKAKLKLKPEGYNYVGCLEDLITGEPPSWCGYFPQYDFECSKPTKIDVFFDIKFGRTPFFKVKIRQPNNCILKNINCKNKKIGYLTGVEILVYHPILEFDVEKEYNPQLLYFVDDGKENFVNVVGGSNYLVEKERTPNHRLKKITVGNGGYVIIHAEEKYYPNLIIMEDGSFEFDVVELLFGKMETKKIIYVSEVIG